MTRGHTTLRRAAAALSLLLVAGCGGTAAGQGHARPDGRMVLVSGRDDHGYEVAARVPLYDAPDSTHEVGTVADGTLAHVTEIDGSWLHVVSAEGRPVVDGWVDDFDLRGVVHLVGPAPSCRASIDGSPVEAGLQVVVQQLRGNQVLVTGVADPTLRGWTTRDAVQELAPQGAGCGEDPPGGSHHHYARVRGGRPASSRRARTSARRAAGWPPPAPGHAHLAAEPRVAEEAGRVTGSSGCGRTAGHRRW